MFFNAITKDGEKGRSRIPSKRKPAELIPKILVEQTSTSTLVEGEHNETTHHSRHLQSIIKIDNRLRKIDKVKHVRYKSRKDYFSQCIAEKLVPKGWKLELEPIISNCDEEFVDLLYSNLKTFFVTLMKDIVIVVHCDPTIVKTEDSIKDTETHLKNVTEREELQSIEETMKNNVANAERLLQQRKFKKVNYLKKIK